MKRLRVQNICAILFCAVLFGGCPKVGFKSAGGGGSLPNSNQSQTNPPSAPLPPGTVVAAFSAIEQLITEGNAGQKAVTVNVQLSQSFVQNLVFPISLAGSSTATSNVDFVLPVNLQVTIPAGQLTGGVTLQVLGDASPESNEFINLNLGSPVGNPANVVLGNPQMHTVRILDDDVVSGGNCVQGAIIAQLESEDPSGIAGAGQSFLIQGSIPVPVGAYKGDHTGTRRYTLADSNGVTYPTDIETVSYHPDGVQASVVYLSGLVPRTAGQRQNYNVVTECLAPTKLTITPSVWAQGILAGDQNTLYVSGSDVYGNRYRASPFTAAAVANQKVYSNGAFKKVIRRFARMLPENPAAANVLPQMMGVFFYLTVYSNSDYMEVSVRLSNGGNSKNGGSFPSVGNSFFDSLDLIVQPQNQVHAEIATPLMDVVDTVSFKLNGRAVVGSLDGQPKKAHYLIQPDALGKMNVLPPGFQVDFNFLLSTAATTDVFARSFLRHQGLAMAKRGNNPQGTALYSWWNPQTSRFTPAALPIGDYRHTTVAALNSALNSRASLFRDAIQTGVPPSGSLWEYRVPAAGYLVAASDQYGGTTGGNGIDHLEREIGMALDSASAEGWAYVRMIEMLWQNRQRGTFLDGNGDPIRAWNMATDPQFFNMPGKSHAQCLNAGNFGQLDSFGVCAAHQANLNSGHEAAVSAQAKLPGYLAAIQNWFPQDYQHSIRAMNPSIAMVQTMNSAISRDHVEQMANNAMLWFNFWYGPGVGARNWALGGGQGLATSSAGRGEGWTHYLMGFYYSVLNPSVAADSLLRSKLLSEYFNPLVETLIHAQVHCPATATYPDFGALSVAVPGSKTYDPVYSGIDPFFIPHSGASGTVSQIWENVIYWFGMRSVFANVMEGMQNPMEAGFREAEVRLGYFLASPMAFGSTMYHYTAITSPDNSQTYCDPGHPDLVANTPWHTAADGNYYRTLFAYEYLVTGNETFICKAIDDLGSVAALKTFIENYGYGYNSLSATLKYVMQNVFNWQRPSSC